MYKHTQMGWVTLLGSLLPVVVLGALVLWVIPCSAAKQQMWGSAILVALISLLAVPVFYSLTVTVDSEAVGFSFGIGIIRRKFLFKDIASCNTVRNKWYCGWGIHGMPGKGWLYNVSGLDAIQLTMKDGMIYLIGTDEPVQLNEEIQKKLKETSQ